MIVLPTAWDDRFLQPRPEADIIGKEAAAKTAADIQNDLTERIERCRAGGIPCIVNIHPCNMVRNNERLQHDAPHLLRETIEWLLAKARAEAIPVLPLSDIAGRSGDGRMCGAAH